MSKYSMRFCIVELVLCLTFTSKSTSLLCYNGTFTSELYGEDPLVFKGLFSPTHRSQARLRCALTIPCPGKFQMTDKICWFLFLCSINEATALLCYNCTANHRDRKNCGGDFTPGQPFINDRQLLINCTGDGAMCFVRSWSARGRYAWMVQRGCYQTIKDDPLPRAMTTPTRAMSCRNERSADAEYKICFCQADWCNSSLSAQIESFVLVIIALVVNSLM